MARVVILSPFDTEYFGGKAEHEVDAATVFDLVRKLDTIGPGFAGAAESRAAFGVDGSIVDDWTAPLGTEVLVLPKVAGG